MKKCALYLFLLTCAGFLTAALGCGGKVTLENMETITYKHPQGGYEVSVPENWELALENPMSAGFVGTDPATAFNVIYEIGGFDYYSMDKLAEEMLLYLSENVEDLRMVRQTKEDDTGGVYQFVAQGTLSGDQDVGIKGIILEPSMGIRYYLLFTAGIKDFDHLDSLFNDIADSFRMNKSTGELYQQLVEEDEEK